MKINDYINKQNFSIDLPKINSLLSSKAHASVNFWGARIIKVDGYEGSITLDEISRKVLNTPIKYLEEEVRIIDFLTKFYRITDSKVEDSSWFTKRLSGIRDFAIFDKPLRIQLDFLKENIMFPSI